MSTTGTGGTNNTGTNTAAASPPIVTPAHAIAAAATMLQNTTASPFQPDPFAWQQLCQAVTGAVFQQASALRTATPSPDPTSDQASKEEEPTQGAKATGDDASPTSSKPTPAPSKPAGRKRKATQAKGASKAVSAAPVKTSRHKYAEQRRRNRISERLDQLRTIVPHAKGTNIASFLDTVIDYVQDLQKQQHSLSSAEQGIVYPQDRLGATKGKSKRKGHAGEAPSSVDAPTPSTPSTQDVLTITSMGPPSVVDRIHSHNSASIAAETSLDWEDRVSPSHKGRPSPYGGVAVCPPRLGGCPPEGCGGPCGPNSCDSQKHAAAVFMPKKRRLQSP